MRTLDQMIAQEVHYCASYLVSTLANHYDAAGGIANLDGSDLAWQAVELCAPIPDYAEAAREAGANIGKRADGLFYWADLDPAEGNEGYSLEAEAATDFCSFRDIEPYEREVFEHWIVSDWLADKLAEHGEKVDKDFAGMTVWARTTTGQGIASDSVMKAIYAEMMAA